MVKKTATCFVSFFPLVLFTFLSHLFSLSIFHHLVIIPVGEMREVRATAYFHPAGVWGLLYWYPLAPFHLWIFKAMTREIARRAELVAVEAGTARGAAGGSPSGE